MEPNQRPRAASDLLSFASPEDIEEFVLGLRRFESGEWTADQFRAFRLNRGTYGQRQPDVAMLRVKIPQGVLTREQLVALADVAETYSRGFCHVTTRQNVQFHFCKLDRIEAAMRRLAQAGLTTKEACGHTIRNVTACPMVGVCPEEPFDCTPFANAVSRHFLRRAENQGLPRKFKIAFSGCPHDCAAGAINDVGLIAKVRDGALGFQVKVAGGLSTTPEDAHLLAEFVPGDELIPVIEAIVAVFDAHGNRENKARARLKYVVRKHGWEWFKAAYEQELAKRRRSVPVDPDACATLSRAPSLPPAPGAQVDSDAPIWRGRWSATNVRRQKQQGFRAVTVRLLRGDITGAQLRGLAQASAQHADGLVRTTIDQNLLLRFVSDHRVASLYADLAALGLAEPGAHTIVDATACPGAESCNLAVTASRELASALTTRLGAPDAAALATAAADLSIKISGCPNSCGQHHLAGLGFHGSMRRVGGKVVPEYTLHLGGGVDGQGATFGRQLAKIPARRVPEALSRLLSLYLQERRRDEPALAFFRRIKEADVQAALADLVHIDETSARPEDFLDLGDAEEFVVATGPGECAS